jgi:hypothetical protein
LLAPDAAPAGIDFFGLDVPVDAPLVTVAVFDYTPDAIDHDCMLAIYHPPGDIWEVDDDGHPGLLPSICFYPPAAGRWTAAFTGLGDYAFLGRWHDRELHYRLVISTGPSACEQGDNDTPNTAELLAPELFAFGAAAVEGVLAPDSSPGGIDFYAVEVLADTLVTASLYDFTPDDNCDADGLLAAYGPAGAMLAFDETSGVGFLPALSFLAPATGRYVLAVTGIGDHDFDGAGHGESFDYRLVVSAPGGVPTSSERPSP